MDRPDKWKIWKKMVADFLARYKYRQVTEKDLVDGKEGLMIEVSPGDMLLDCPAYWGKHIVLDKHPKANGKIYYRVGLSRCFVPLELFLGGMDVMIAPKTILFIVRE